MTNELMLKQGLEYSVKMPEGHTVHYLSKDTAHAYWLFGATEIIAPIQGPNIPDAIAKLRT